MQTPLDYIRKYPHRTKQILGINYNQFVQLVVQAKLHHEQRQAGIEETKIRINDLGADGNQNCVWK